MKYGGVTLVSKIVRTKTTVFHYKIYRAKNPEQGVRSREGQSGGVSEMGTAKDARQSDNVTSTNKTETNILSKSLLAANTIPHCINRSTNFEVQIYIR